MESKKTAILRIIMKCAVGVSAVMYLVTDNILFKSAASFLFFAIGTLNLILTRQACKYYKKFPALLMCGLFSAMAGDIAINHSFIAGAVIFAVGHIFFFAAQCTLCPSDRKTRTRDRLCGGCLLAGTVLILIAAPLEFGSTVMFAVCLLYSAIISMMTGKAISSHIGSKKKIFRHMLTGTSLFMLSDLMLVIYGFGGKTAVFHYLCIILYYTAEVILADSFLVIAEEKDNAPHNAV